MQETTVYLPADLEAAPARQAQRRGPTQAEPIREAISATVEHPRHRAGPFESDEPFAELVDELPEGFGHR